MRGAGRGVLGQAGAAFEGVSKGSGAAQAAGESVKIVVVR